MALNLALWVAGAILLIVGIVMIQRPISRLNELRRLRENADRYEAWRGGSHRTAADPSERTGADEMADLLRQRVYLWGAAIAGGIVLLVLGFAIR